ncbi:uncharacterized protein N7446_008450 [Penicillium canescens]|uniref:Uncharacterized protein n=1 Tax=Penicillium canescens TaxID=5083 RepID=A0AAD6NEI3_PENCN|nr:uncharacterized protein N7446_008450 [Penicillium canescens]KAJ6033259.1 hypothetical protein N7444_011030 [Penicillium canescens]KAJ6057551.1 hypothetical protein N7460_000825 [Penicillium canescens]KAJ6058867.1 hypothetical protein N7446_008450 [Penicillium canescens]
MEVHELVHDASKGKAAVYITSMANTPFEGNFKWTNEYAVFPTFSEDGQKYASWRRWFQKYLV